MGNNSNEKEMSWFQSKDSINASFEQLIVRLADMPRFNLGVVKYMPGLSKVALLAQSSDQLVIQTNEGVMTRTNFAVKIENDEAIFAFSESYKIGWIVTIKSEVESSFRSTKNGIEHHLEIKIIEVNGIAGWLFTKLGRNHVGKSVLEAYRGYLEN